MTDEESIWLWLQSEKDIAIELRNNTTRQKETFKIGTKKLIRQLVFQNLNSFNNDNNNNNSNNNNNQNNDNILKFMAQNIFKDLYKHES